MANRIGAACWFRRYEHKGNGGLPGTTKSAWSMDHEEYSDGVGHFPVAVVEDDATGVCHSVHVNYVCFHVSPPPI